MAIWTPAVSARCLAASSWSWMLASNMPPMALWSAGEMPTRHLLGR